MKPVKTYVPEDIEQFLASFGSVGVSKSMLLKYLVLSFYSEVTGKVLDADYKKMLELLVQLKEG